MAYLPLDEGSLLRRLDVAANVWRSGTRCTDLRRVHGGASGLTFAATLECADDPFVAIVKVAPAGLEPVRNRDVLRQARIQRALGEHGGIPVPEILFTATGEGLEAPPFYVMSRVDGACFEPLLDRVDLEPLDDVALLARRAHELARLVAKLHGVPTARVAELGLSELSLEAEVERWRRALQARDGALGPAGEECAAALLATIPQDGEVRVVHGDLRLGNALCVGDQVTALLDWEICALGDPRLDVGWLCSFVDSTNLLTRVRDVPGLPTPDELVATYQDERGMNLDDFDWFRALALYKHAAVTALIVKNNAHQEPPDPHLAELGPTVEATLARALELMSVHSHQANSPD